MYSLASFDAGILYIPTLLPPSGTVVELPARKFDAPL